IKILPALVLSAAMVQVSHAGTFTDVFSFLSSVFETVTGISDLIRPVPSGSVRLWSQHGNMEGARDGYAASGDVYDSNFKGLGYYPTFQKLGSDEYSYGDMKVRANPYTARVYNNGNGDTCLGQIRLLYNSNGGSQDAHFSALIAGDNLRSCGQLYGPSQTVIRVGNDEMLSSCVWLGARIGGNKNIAQGFFVDLNAFSMYAEKNWNNCGLFRYFKSEDNKKRAEEGDDHDHAAAASVAKAAMIQRVHAKVANMAVFVGDDYISAYCEDANLLSSDLYGEQLYCHAKEHRISRHGGIKHAEAHVAFARLPRKQLVANWNHTLALPVNRGVNQTLYN
ncbi:hypothetical protein BGZ67_010379, partial [Mortierella alpina]